LQRSTTNGSLVCRLTQELHLHFKKAGAYEKRVVLMLKDFAPIITANTKVTSTRISLDDYQHPQPLLLVAELQAIYLDLTSPWSSRFIITQSESAHPRANSIPRFQDGQRKSRTDLDYHRWYWWHLNRIGRTTGRMFSTKEYDTNTSSL